MSINSITNRFGYAARLAIGGLLTFALVSCGGGGGSPGTVPNAPPPPDPAAIVGSVKLVFSSPELKSSGATGSEVAVTALVRNADNNAMAGVAVSFTTDSGILTGVDTVSDSNGQAKATLGIAGDHTNRTITVHVQAGGATGKADEGTVNVVNTTVAIAGPTAIAINTTADYTVTVKDSAGVAVVDAPVTFTSQKGNPIVVKTSSSHGGTATAPWTNAQGQVVLTLTASNSGADTLTMSAQGATKTLSLNVNAATLTLTTYDSGNNPVTQATTSSSCDKVIAHYEINNVAQTGIANISTSRGTLFTDSACLTPLSSGSVPVVSGNSQATYLKSDYAGIATVTASIVGGPSTQTDLEFIAALTINATIDLQADPAVIGTTEQSTLTAVVRDGSGFNNFVKGQVVNFTIVKDASGGALSNPQQVTTLSNGSASVDFIAGLADTPTDGVTIQATLQATGASVTKSLTVAKKALFIRAGTGNKLATPSSTTYQLDYAVFVTDASGNPVPNATVTASLWPTQYRKGSYTFAGTWVFADPFYTCPNEDLNQNGILDPGEDDVNLLGNGNGVLDPGIPVNVTSSGTTDDTGTATVSILYPRDRANWTDVKLTIVGRVSGTESKYITSFSLPGLAADFASAASAPPGDPSPYGVNPCNQPD